MGLIHRIIPAVLQRLACLVVLICRWFGYDWISIRATGRSITYMGWCERGQQMSSYADNRELDAMMERHFPNQERREAA